MSSSQSSSFSYSDVDISGEEFSRLFDACVDSSMVLDADVCGGYPESHASSSQLSVSPGGSGSTPLMDDFG